MTRTSSASPSLQNSLRLAAFLATAAVLAPAQSARRAEAMDNPPLRKQPRLLLTIMIDQFRYDYTKRFRADYHGGLDRLLRQGAVYENAHQDHFPTLTSPGHTTILSGSTPHESGIIGNAWYDRTLRKQVTSVEDASTRIVGESTLDVGASPHNLQVTTVPDELKLALRGTSKTVSVSLKDVAAILMAGRSADAAYWFDVTSGKVVTSTYYAKQLPPWVADFNKQVLDFKPGALWMPTVAGANGGKPWTALPAKVDEQYIFEWRQTAMANDALEELAERALGNEQLGTHPMTDVLAVSFSANDHLGHAVGPDAPQVRDLAVETDRLIGKLIDRATAQVGGKENLLVVLSSDHGVVQIPETMVDRHFTSARVPKEEPGEVLQKALSAKYGDGKWVDNVGFFGPIYLNHDLIAEKKLNLDAVVADGAAALKAMPSVEDVYTVTELAGHTAPRTERDRLMFRGYNHDNGGDMIIVFRPNYIHGPLATTHASPYNYDTHVPLVFWGGSIQPGDYVERVGISDVAPTLSVLLNIQMPNGSVGAVLPEVTNLH